MGRSGTTRQHHWCSYRWKLLRVPNTCMAAKGQPRRQSIGPGHAGKKQEDVYELSAQIEHN